MHTMAGALLALAFLQAPSQGAVPSAPGGAPPAPTAPQPPAASATEPAPPAAAAQPPAPGDAPVTTAFAIEAGARLPLSATGEVVVDPGASFELELAARLVDARLVLVDGRGDLVPASGTREVGSVTRLTLRPSTPLSPGSRYALRLDGVTQSELRDDAGRAFAPLTLPVLAAGTPPPAEPKRTARKKRR